MRHHPQVWNSKTDSTVGAKKFWTHLRMMKPKAMVATKKKTPEVQLLVRIWVHGWPLSACNRGLLRLAHGIWIIMWPKAWTWFVGWTSRKKTCFHAMLELVLECWFLSCFGLLIVMDLHLGKYWVGTLESWIIPPFFQHIQPVQNRTLPLTLHV